MPFVAVSSHRKNATLKAAFLLEYQRRNRIETGARVRAQTAPSTREVQCGPGAPDCRMNHQQLPVVSLDASNPHSEPSTYPAGDTLIAALLIGAGTFLSLIHI